MDVNNTSNIFRAACDCDGNEEMSKTTPRRRKGYIPYVTIYESQEKVRKCGYWIPETPIEATVVKVEKNNSAYYLLNPFVYTIRLKHGKYEWQVIKQYKDFSYLRNRLLAHRAIERIKTPMRRARHRLEEVIEGDDNSQQRHVCTNNDTSLTELRILERSAEIGDVTLNYQDSFDNAYDNSSRSKRRETSDMSLPHFPMIPDSMVSDAHMQERKERLEAWLQSVLNIPINRDYHETAEFLEVSRFSFINELGGKYREGTIKKRPGGNKVYIGCKQCCMRWFLPWGKRWLVIKDSYVCYVDPSDEGIRLVLLFDEQFEINSADLAVDIRPKEIILSNLQHVLNMKCSRQEDTIYWIRDIKSVLENTGDIWLRKKLFGSSFPPREKIYCQWFVDAKDYWQKASEMIELAREEIFIADWWLCPEIYMRRPMAEGNHWRLDYILKRQAEKGVRIFILLYKEMEMALMLNTLASKRHLQKLHPNIKVMRHPDHYFGTGTFFWAHHEKLLIIDQLIAFVGGLDLCYGRWDTSAHALTDLGSVQIVSSLPETKLHEDNLKHADGLVEGLVKDRVPNSDENMNQVKKKAKEIKEEDENLGDSTALTFRHNGTHEKSNNSKHNLREAMHRVMGRVKHGSREPTPDKSSNHMSDETVEANHLDEKDVSKATLTFRNAAALFGRDHDRNYSRSDGGNEKFGDLSVNLTHSKATPLVIEPRNRTMVRRVVSNLMASKNKKRWRMAMDQEDNTADEYVINYCRQQESKVDISGLQGAGKLWPGKDYVNYVLKDFVDLENTYHDFINRYKTPRTPWHDIHGMVYGESARDLARHFIQRWNATKTEKLKDDTNYPYLVPKSYNSIRVPRVFINPHTFCADVQVLRSVSHWSTLIDKTEDSIQQAYVSLIANAKHFIYIENQFFVSMINSVDVTNEVSRVICERITRAHKNSETFRIYIIIPLLPGFEGDIGNQYSSLLAVLNWTMLSVSKGPYSLLQNLLNNGVDDPWNYLSFCSLRTHDELCGKLVSEMIYVHCKLLIIDDIYTIIGSANINDRSQLGNRDSEVCILVKDREYVNSKMNGVPYQAGKFSSSLRRHLMKEHLGLLEESRVKPTSDKIKQISLEDPIIEHFFKDIWCKAAANNTKIYEDVFRSYPTNVVETFLELTAWRAETPLAETDPEKAREQLSKLIGQIVQFPTEFLKREDLSPTIISKEGLVPSAVFT